MPATIRLKQPATIAEMRISGEIYAQGRE
jgi:hypothetical protein